MLHTCLRTALSLLLLAAYTHPARADNALLEHYYHLHANPELSLQEARTAKYMGAQLQQLGYTINTDMGGHGLVAMLENGAGPTVMYRADMDALPVVEKTGLPYASKITATDTDGVNVGVMHACGHDIHMATLLGVAQRMATEQTDWQGTLLLVLEPAEEIGAGARMMIEAGLYSRFRVPDYNLAFHVSPDLPAGTVGIISGFAMANVDSVDITVRGSGGHGAYPHKTSDPIVIAAQIVTALQTIVSRNLSPLDSAVVTVGSIHGGTKHNIIGDEVRLQLTVRSYSDETRELILRRIREISAGIATSAGVASDKLPIVEIKDQYTPAVYNDPELIAVIEPVLAGTLGQAQLRPVDPVMAGEDFSRYGRTEADIHSALLWLGAVEPERYKQARQTGEPLPGLHSAYFAPDAPRALDTGVNTMTAVLQSLLRAKR